MQSHLSFSVFCFVDVNREAKASEIYNQTDETLALLEIVYAFESAEVDINSKNI